MPIKILHVTNIAGNAYTNALILERSGYVCDVLAYDYYHFASSPEWYDLLQIDNIPNIIDNDYFPDFYRLNQDMPIIGGNVAHGPMFNALAYLDLRRRNHPLAEVALDALRYLRFKGTMLKTTMQAGLSWSSEEFHTCLQRYNLPHELKLSILSGRLADDILQLIQSRITRFNPPESVKMLSVPFRLGVNSPLSAVIAIDPLLAEILAPMLSSELLYALGLAAPEPLSVDVKALAHIGSESELRPFCAYGAIWRRLHAAYDVIIFYADSSMYAVTNGIMGYCALEHGTIRSIPFEDSTYGRLVAAGFRQADKVFITNADYVTSERRLEFRPSQAVYLPHPFDEKLAFDLRAAFRPPPRVDGKVRFFSPTRQDWRSRDPKMSKANDYVFYATRALIDMGVTNFELTFVAWGVDLQSSKDLCVELGIEEYVHWVPPLAKRQLWEEKLASDCVIDQFLISAMGGISFETLALGRRLISRNDGIENAVFFGESPPILNASTVEEIKERLLEVISDPDDDNGVGTKGMRWISEFHSAHRNTLIQEDAFRQILASRHSFE